MTETTLFSDPVINVIEQDLPGRMAFAEQSGEDGRARNLDAAAMDAVSARRRREFDAARAGLRDQAVRDGTGTRQPGTRPAPDASLGAGDTARAPIDQPPERVRKRYLRAGNQYFLKDVPYQLAFEDLGPYLVTEHNRPDVVESMVDMVAAKSWQRIRVSGHQAFRSEVWLQGTLLGIEVSGYEPKAADLARLADARQAHLSNRIEADASRPTTGTQLPADDNRTPAKASDFQTERPGAARPVSPISGDPARSYRSEPQVVSDEPETPRKYAGELREHGSAPYLHNPARSDSYYVLFRDARGTDRVVWGVDLERAMLASRAEPGQHVTLENQGRRLVTVKVPILDDHGMAVGEEEKDVYRNTWQVDVVRRDRSIAESAGRSERSSGTATAPANAPAREDRQEHRRSTVSDEDKVLHLAVLVGAMREQGFSARSIARVQQRAEELLDAFGREGIPVPRPRVFDPKAPSARDRRARPTAGRAPVPEVEREIVRTPADPSPAR
ncbi:LPD7 domain-containing protein [Caballeronia sp. 15715]|uniref:LPD7 domain-containing protein n=1 Tax=Caballeronia sp. 15715 TaxID=3391030 RepID=UPI0039E28C3A